MENPAGQSSSTHVESGACAVAWRCCMLVGPRCLEGQEAGKEGLGRRGGRGGGSLPTHPPPPDPATPRRVPIGAGGDGCKGHTVFLSGGERHGESGAMRRMRRKGERGGASRPVILPPSPPPPPPPRVAPPPRTTGGHTRQAPGGRKKEGGGLPPMAKPAMAPEPRGRSKGRRGCRSPGCIYFFSFFFVGFHPPSPPPWAPVDFVTHTRPTGREEGEGPAARQSRHVHAASLSTRSCAGHSPLRATSPAVYTGRLSPIASGAPAPPSFILSRSSPVGCRGCR